MQKNTTPAKARQTRAPRNPKATPKPAPTPTPAPEAAEPTPTPEAAAPAPAPRDALCACGCGAPTITAKALFVSGHDARLAGVLGRALAANPADEDAKARLERLTPALQKKALSVKATADRKAAEKAAKAAARAAAAKAYADALQAAKA